MRVVQCHLEIQDVFINRLQASPSLTLSLMRCPCISWRVSLPQLCLLAPQASRTICVLLVFDLPSGRKRWRPAVPSPVPACLRSPQRLQEEGFCILSPAQSAICGKVSSIEGYYSTTLEVEAQLSICVKKPCWELKTCLVLNL